MAALGCLAAIGMVLHGILTLAFWHDELYSLNAAAESPGFAMTRYTLPDVHPPLYYLLLHFWSGLFGTGAVAARSLSLLPALAGVWVLWHQGARLSLSPVALSLATLWLLTNWTWVSTLQDVRMYGLVLLGCAWLCLAFARLWAKKGEIALAELSLFSLVALLTSLLHYFAMALACAALLLLLLRCRHKPGLWPPILLSGSLCLLWLLAVFFLAVTTVHAWLPILSPRYLTAIAPPLALCVGCLGSLIWGRRPWALCGLSLVLGCASLAASWQASEHRWLRGGEIGMAGPRELVQRLAEDDAGARVYCQVCSHIWRPFIGANSPRLLGGLPKDAPVAHISIERDWRHLIPPFYGLAVNPWVLEPLRREAGLRVKVLTPGADEDGAGHHKVSIHASQGP